MTSEPLERKLDSAGQEAHVPGAIEDLDPLPSKGVSRGDHYARNRARSIWRSAHGAGTAITYELMASMLRLPLQVVVDGRFLRSRGQSPRGVAYRLKIAKWQAQYLAWEPADEPPLPVSQQTERDPLDDERAGLIESLLRQGVPPHTVETALRAKRRHVARIAAAIGWEPQWSVALTPFIAAGRLTGHDLVELARKGVTAAEIAKRAGIPEDGVRERLARLRDPDVRLANPHERRAAMREERLLAKAVRLRTYLARAKSMWSEGASLADIARAYHIPQGTLSTNIAFARQYLGSDWFRLRRPSKGPARVRPSPPAGS